jgi:transcription elongation factor
MEAKVEKEEGRREKEMGGVVRPRPGEMKGYIIC